MVWVFHRNSICKITFEYSRNLRSGLQQLSRPRVAHRKTAWTSPQFRILRSGNLPLDDSPPESPDRCRCRLLGHACTHTCASEKSSRTSDTSQPCHQRLLLRLPGRSGAAETDDHGTMNLRELAPDVGNIEGRDSGVRRGRIKKSPDIPTVRVWFRLLRRPRTGLQVTPRRPRAALAGVLRSVRRATGVVRRYSSDGM